MRLIVTLRYLIHFHVQWLQSLEVRSGEATKRNKIPTKVMAAVRTAGFVAFIPYSWSFQ